MNFKISELTKKEVLEKAIGSSELESIIITIDKESNRFSYQVDKKKIEGRVPDIKGEFFYEENIIFKSREEYYEREEWNYLSHSDAIAFNFYNAVLKNLEFIEEENDIKYYGAILKNVELRKRFLGKTSSDMFYYDIVDLEIEFGTKKDLLK